MIRPKILFFDVNETLLDLAPAKKRIAEGLGGRDDLVSLWFTSLLHYSLVVSAGGHYDHFGTIGAAALEMVAANHGIAISQEDAQDLVSDSLQDLPAHSDVKPALARLKREGYHMVSFTNGSKNGVRKQFEFAGLDAYFDERLSVEEAGMFKPFREAYRWAVKRMGVRPHEAMMIAAHGWDVAGALWAGWRAAFIHRPGQQLFPLAPKTEIVAQNLQIATDILISYLPR